MTAKWRDDIDALQFDVGDERFCMVHRLAFRQLTGMRSPGVADCVRFFQRNEIAFRTAARDKIARAGGLGAGNFHLTSRDVQGAITVVR